MPFLIPLIPVLAGLTGAALAAATIALTVIELVALSLLAKMLAPSPPGSQLSNGVTQEYSGTVAPRRIAYGTNLMAGMNAIPPWCHGTNNQMLDQVLVVAGHEVAAIRDCWANQEKIPTASITAITGSQSDGLVTTGTYAGKLWIRRKLGTQTDTVDTILLAAWPSSWDVNHKGLGIAKLCIQFAYDATVYSGGKAEIRALVDGKKVYDPRLDTAPGANPFNPSYIAFSANPALCIVDYLLDPVLGVGEASTRIDWAAAVAAANLCDENVAIPGSLTQKRYRCNTVLDCTESYEANLGTLAASFQGAVLYSSGKWVLLPSHYQTSTFSIGDDDVAGAFDYQTAVPFANRYNAVRGQFYDPTNLFQPTEYPPIRVGADEITDGEGPVWRELQQPGCTDVFEAQRNAIILQRRSRRKKSWSFPVNYSLYSIRPGDFGTLSITELSISSQPVRCTGWKLDGKAMTIAIQLEEVAAADWNDPATVVYQTLAALATPAPANFVSDPTSSFNAIPGAGGITFRWNLPTIWHSNLSVELLEADFNNLALATMVWSGVNTSVFIQKTDTLTRYYWTRIRNFAGNTTSVTQPLLTNAGLAAAAATAAGPKGDPGATGAPGTGGLSASLSLSAVVLPATTAGHVTDYSAAQGTFKVFVGTLDVTSLCSFALAPLGNPSGLIYGIGGNTDFGLMTLAEGQSIVAVGTMSSGVNQAFTAEGQTLAGVGSTTTGAAVTTFEAQTVSAAGSGGPINTSGPEVSGEAQTSSGVGIGGAAAQGNTAEGQKVIAVGSVGGGTWDSSFPTWDTGATLTWDASSASGTTGAPVVGTITTGE